MLLFSHLHTKDEGRTGHRLSQDVRGITNIINIPIISINLFASTKSELSLSFTWSLGWSLWSHRVTHLWVCYNIIRFNPVTLSPSSPDCPSVTCPLRLLGRNDQDISIQSS